MFLFIDLDHTIIADNTNNIIYDAIEKDSSLKDDRERQWALIKDLSLIGTAEEWQKEISKWLSEDNFICLVSFSAYPHIGERILIEKMGLERLEPTVLDQIPVISFMPENPKKENKNKHIEKGLEALAEKFLERMKKPHEITEKEKQISKQFYILLTYLDSKLIDEFKFAEEWISQDKKAKTTLREIEAYIAPIDYLKEVILVDDSERNIKGAKEAHYRTITATPNGGHLQKISTLRPYLQSLECILDQAKREFIDYSSFEEDYIEDLFEAMQEDDENKIGKILFKSIQKNYNLNVPEKSYIEDCKDYTHSAVKFLARHQKRAEMSLEEIPKIKERIESIRKIIKEQSIEKLKVSSKEKRKHEDVESTQESTSGKQEKKPKTEIQPLIIGGRHVANIVPLTSIFGPGYKPPQNSTSSRTQAEIKPKQ